MQSPISSIKHVIAIASGKGTRADGTDQLGRAVLRGLSAIGPGPQYQALIDDGTYFAAIVDGVLAGCGGWSYRKTLFGADGRSDREPENLDPAVDAAKIRAFFVEPTYARRGIGKALLDHCEDAARDAGFSRAELMSTLPGLRLYARFGYVAGDSVDYALEGGGTIPFVPMTKSL